MAGEGLGTLKRVDLRKMWKNEEKDFTPWLAEQGLPLLSEALEIGELVFNEREARVGRYEADIVARNDDDKIVVIENQIGQSDHSHLGKCLTYAAGRNADFIVWIVGAVTEEHRRVVQWLNDNGGERINIFLVQIEGWMVDGSRHAPRFNVIVRPEVQLKQGMSETEQRQLAFWTAFREYAAGRADFRSKFSFRTPRPQCWYTFSVGSGKWHLFSRVSDMRGRVCAGIYFRDNEQYGKAYEALKRKLPKAEFSEKSQINPTVCIY